jgi:hypothetical protein
VAAPAAVRVAAAAWVVGAAQAAGAARAVGAPAGEAQREVQWAVGAPVEEEVAGAQRPAGAGAAEPALPAEAWVPPADEARRVVEVALVAEAAPVARAAVAGAAWVPGAGWAAAARTIGIAARAPKKTEWADRREAVGGSTACRPARIQRAVLELGRHGALFGYRHGRTANGQGLLGFQARGC